MISLACIISLVGCAASIDDLRRRAIANWINVSGLIAGLLWHTLHEGVPGLLRAMGGAAVGFSVFLIFYCLGGIGAGDLKLAAAFGALLGPSEILVAALLAAPVGGVMAAFCILWKWQTRAIPYAPALSLGAWLVSLARG